MACHNCKVRTTKLETIARLCRNVKPLMGVLGECGDVGALLAATFGMIYAASTSDRDIEGDQLEKESEPCDPSKN
jgi:hypothetical protein